MQIIRAGLTQAAAGLRTVLLRPRQGAAFDIYMVRWVFIGTDISATNDTAAMALSTRTRDLVEDTATIGFDEIAFAHGLFAATSFEFDIITEGGMAIVASDTIPFPKPYTVAFLSAVFNIALATQANIGVEVYYERRSMPALDVAQLVIEQGGRLPS